MLHSKTAAKCKRKGQRPKAVGNGGQEGMQPSHFGRSVHPYPTGGGGRFGQPPTQIFRPFTALGPERHLVSGHIEAVGKLVHSLEAASRPIEN
jgi:hypothetical protein